MIDTLFIFCAIGEVAGRDRMWCRTAVPTMPVAPVSMRCMALVVLVGVFVELVSVVLSQDPDRVCNAKTSSCIAIGRVGCLKSKNSKVEEMFWEQAKSTYLLKIYSELILLSACSQGVC